MTVPKSLSDLSIPFPNTKQVRGRGIYATTAPYGVRVTINCSKYEVDLMDAARSYIDHEPTMSAFIRQVSAAAAVAILEMFEPDHPLVRTYHARLADGGKHDLAGEPTTNPTD